MLYRLIFLAAFCICSALSVLPRAEADTVRKPAVAGTFYPAEPELLKGKIAELTAQAQKSMPATSAGRPVKAMLMPHAGYVYSGLTAAHAAPLLKDENFSKIIIIAPDHRAGFYGGAISDADSYQTPLGKVPVHKDAHELREKYGFFRTVPASDAKEHAVEVILPFLQMWLSDFEIIPVVMGRGPAIDLYVSALETVIDQDTLVIASTDLSHYLPYEKANSRDRQTIKRIESLDTDWFSDQSNRACGHVPVSVLIEIAGTLNWEPRLIHYSNSGDTFGKKDKVVGYATIAFYGEKEMSEHQADKQITTAKGEVLLELARKSIADRLGVDYKPGSGIEASKKDPVFQARRGTFVTLKINGNLRGCIGNLMPDKSLAEGVKDNAVKAAFNDPRFAPLSKEEFSRIRIEVSLLTEPAHLEYDDAQDLLDKIRPGVDGLIIRKGPCTSTFLPQVWEQLPDKKTFLGQLCMKAGLPPDEWEKGDLQVFTYQVRYFEESA